MPQEAALKKDKKKKKTKTQGLGKNEPVETLLHEWCYPLGGWSMMFTLYLSRDEG